MNKIISGLVTTLILLAGCAKQAEYRYPAKPQAFIDGRTAAQNIIHLVKDTVYILTVNLYRDSGQQLIVDAGTLVKVNDLLSITINSGGIIEANGTSSDPVVFTSANGTGKQGFGGNGGNWDGLRINGTSGGAGSGTLTYTRIEFAGLYTSSVLLTGVNSKTTISNIEISYSFNNPSLELNGGNCNLSNIVSYASAGTDFLIHNGYIGNMQNLLAYRSPLFATKATNLAGVFITDPGTAPAISNLTVIGPDTKYGLNGNYTLGGNALRAAMVTNGGSVLHIRNSVFLDFPLRTYYLDNYNTSDSIAKRKSEIMFSSFFNSDTSSVFQLADNAYPPFNTNDMRNFLLADTFMNKMLTDRSQYKLTDPYNYYSGIPNPMPAPGSPLLSGADFNSPVFDNSFFHKVNYIGALGDVNWMQPWVNFIPLQTNYNN